MSILLLIEIVSNHRLIEVILRSQIFAIQRTDSNLERICTLLYLLIIFYFSFFNLKFLSINLLNSNSGLIIQYVRLWFINHILRMLSLFQIKGISSFLNLFLFFLDLRDLIILNLTCTLFFLCCQIHFLAFTSLLLGLSRVFSMISCFLNRWLGKRIFLFMSLIIYLWCLLFQLLFDGRNFSRVLWSRFNISFLCNWKRWARTLI